MAAPFLSASVSRTGFTAFKNRLRSFDQSIVAATSPKLIGDVLVSRLQERMKGNKTASGGSYDSISESGMRWRRWAKVNPSKAGYAGSKKGRIHASPLMFSGRLHDSIKVSKSSSVRINTGSGFRITADAANARNGFLYGRAHQKGEGSPKRPFLTLNTSDAEAVVERMKRKIITGV